MPFSCVIRRNLPLQAPGCSARVHLRNAPANPASAHDLFATSSRCWQDYASRAETGNLDSNRPMRSPRFGAGFEGSVVNAVIQSVSHASQRCSPSWHLILAVLPVIPQFRQPSCPSSLVGCQAAGRNEDRHHGSRRFLFRWCLALPEVDMDGSDLKALSAVGINTSGMVPITRTTSLEPAVPYHAIAPPHRVAAPPLVHLLIIPILFG